MQFFASKFRAERCRFGMKSGAVELKYTEMKKQETSSGQLSWQWVWYENAEEPSKGRPYAQGCFL